MIATTLHSLLNIRLSPYNPITYNESSIIIFSDPEDNYSSSKISKTLATFANMPEIHVQYTLFAPSHPPPPAPLPPTKFGMSAVFSFSKDN